MNKWIKHPPHKEGSREHVISYSTHGRHCSEEDCEINKPRRRRIKTRKEKKDIFRINIQRWKQL